MLKYIALGLVVMMSSINGMEMHIAKSFVRAPNALGDIDVTLDTEGFWVADTRVHDHDMDPELRAINYRQLAKILGAGAYLRVNQYDTNEYSLRLEQRLRGGGLGGAWLGASVGYWGVKIAGYGALLGVTTAMDLAVPGTGTALGFAIQAPCVAAIESLSTYAALCGGAAGGVATGFA